MLQFKWMKKTLQFSKQRVHSEVQLLQLKVFQSRLEKFRANMNTFLPMINSTIFYLQ